MTSSTPDAADGRQRLPGSRTYLIAVAISMIVLVVSSWLIVSALDSRAKSQPIEGGITTTGTVVAVGMSVAPGRKTGRSKGYRAVIRFIDHEGREHTFTGRSGGQRPTVGDPAQVSYDPTHPEVARDLTFNRESWRWSFWTGILGEGVGLLVALGTATALIRQRRRAVRAR